MLWIALLGLCSKRLRLRLSVLDDDLRHADAVHAVDAGNAWDARYATSGQRWNPVPHLLVPAGPDLFQVVQPLARAGVSRCGNQGDGQVLNSIEFRVLSPSARGPILGRDLPAAALSIGELSC
jgi:hypothetical protein